MSHIELAASTLWSGHLSKNRGNKKLKVPPNQAWKKLTPMQMDYWENSEVILICGYKYDRCGDIEGPDGRHYWRVKHCRNKYGSALIRPISAGSLVLTVTTSPVYLPEEPEQVGTFKVTCTTYKVTCTTLSGDTCYEGTWDRLTASQLLNAVRKKVVASDTVTPSMYIALVDPDGNILEGKTKVINGVARKTWRKRAYSGTDQRTMNEVVSRRI